MKLCETCGKYIFKGLSGRHEGHRCPPFFYVWNPDHSDGNDTRKTFASDAEDAVEEWAERDDADSAEYSIVGGEDAEVCVKDGAGNVTRWRVSGESMPSYSATQLNAEGDDA
jgi:hypothetical protein